MGFYYIPGTDMCIKVGGYVRSQAEWGSSNGIPAGTNSIPLTGPNTIVNGLFNRASNNFNFSGRAMISVDARNESEYGTIRGYLRIGAQTFSNSETSSFVADRAFIQFAGFTAGRAVSFFDIFTTTEAFSYSELEDLGRHVQLWSVLVRLHGRAGKRRVRHDLSRGSTSRRRDRWSRRRL